MYAAFDIHLVPANELLKKGTHIPCSQQPTSKLIKKQFNIVYYLIQGLRHVTGNFFLQH